MISHYQAERMNGIPFSGIRSVFEEVARREAQGESIVAFHIGRPDFDTPEHIKNAAKKALDDGLINYTSNYGLLSLREAIAAKLARENQIVVDPASQIIVTLGANEAVFISMMALLNPGDEILIPDPMWTHYLWCARLAGANVVSVPLSERNGFQLDPDDLERRISKRTRMVVLNSPHNPTGVVFNRETIAAVADIVTRHGLYLLSDEIYQQILYEDSVHLSPASLPRVAGRTLTIGGFSKAYAMTGWRLGYVVASPELIDVLIRVHQYTTICATSFAQAGAIVALTGSQTHLTEMVNAFDQRRRAVVRAFADLPQAPLVTPTGAFYAFPNVKAFGGTSTEVATNLLQDANVAVVPGSAFGNYGEGYIRLAYSCALPDVERGLAAIKAHWKAVS